MSSRLALALPLAGAMTCPGSSAIFHHASCKIVTAFEEDCATVQAEMEARIAGENGWFDPHNKGIYSKTGGSGDQLDVSRETGNKKYTDKLIFTFVASGSGCELSGCSESQVTSLLDFGTNYCNLHDLYAGSQDGQKFAKTDLKYKESVSSCTDSSNTGKSKCAVVTEDPVDLMATVATVDSAIACPGSPAHFHHASCKIVTAFEEDCATVQAEMEARIAGENGWFDPHNKGIYSKTGEEKYMSGTELDVKRETGNKKYTDLLKFTFVASGSGCELSSCSESQVTSLLDFGTNYCNLHDLYAGSQDGQKFAKTDLKYKESVSSCTDSSDSGKSKCDVVTVETFV